MLTFAAKYGFNEYSQNNEDGIINEILVRIGKTLGVSVEFGGHDGYFCSNTRRLIDKGWTGYMYDINPGNTLVVQREITPDNVNDLPVCDVLSMDTDGADFDLWLHYEGRPDVVIIEINSSLQPMEEHHSKEKGASYLSMLMLGLAKGYFLVAHTGNLIFCLNEHRALFSDIVGDGIINYKDYFKTDWLQ